MIVLLHPDQAAEVRLLAIDLGLDEDEVVRHLLSGPLLDLTSPSLSLPPA